MTDLTHLRINMDLEITSFLTLSVEEVMDLAYEGDTVRDKITNILAKVVDAAHKLSDFDLSPAHIEVDVDYTFDQAFTGKVTIHGRKTVQIPL